MQSRGDSDTLALPGIGSVESMQAFHNEERFEAPPRRDAVFTKVAAAQLRAP